MIPSKRQHRRFNPIPTTHMLSAALIALYQLSSRHHVSFPSVAVLLFAFPQTTTICALPPRFGDSQSSIIHSTSHCSPLLSSMFVSLPMFPLSFLWPQWTWLVWPCLSLVVEEWDGGLLSLSSPPSTPRPLGGKKCSVPQCMCHLFFHTYSSHPQAPDTYHCTYLVFAALFYHRWSSTMTWKILSLPLYYADYISDAAETNKTELNSECASWEIKYTEN